MSEIVGWDYAVKCLSTVPVVAAALGPVAGLPAAEVPASHFSVMVKGAAQVFSAGPPLVEHATGETADEGGARRLGGRHPCRHRRQRRRHRGRGARAEIRRFLSYLPSHVWALPPVRESTDDPRRRDLRLRDAVPTHAPPVDTRAVIRSICDEGCVFEIGARFGRPVVGTLARIDGHPSAVLGTDGRFDGAGFSMEAALKLARFVDFADTFHLPVVYLVDNPGVMIGLAAEQAGTLRFGLPRPVGGPRGAFPWASVLVRRCFGVGGATHRNEARHSLRVAWPSGSWGSLPLEGGVEAAYKRVIEASPDPEAPRRAARPPAGRALAVPYGRELHGRGHHRPGRHPPGPRAAGSAPPTTRWPRVRSGRRAGRSGPDRPRPHRSLDPEERQVGLAVERGSSRRRGRGTR